MEQVCCPSDRNKNKDDLLKFSDAVSPRDGSAFAVAGRT
jgi:hypothetical protein